ncbi:MAG: hypothetical protein N4A50_06295 [Vallitalea sp.]|jgi:hypothetical protein|nr:hypothetical protein [Vallitalea sp.]
MERGSLIIYDMKGKIWFNSGDAQGDVLPHISPYGLPFVITEYGQLDNKKVTGVNPVTKELITEEIKVKPTYEDLENQLLLSENAKVEGGIF